MPGVYSDWAIKGSEPSQIASSIEKDEFYDWHKDGASDSLSA